MRRGRSTICDPFALSLSKGLILVPRSVVRVLRRAQDERNFLGLANGLALRQAQDERGLCLRGGAADWLGAAGVAERCVLLGPSPGSGRAGCFLQGAERIGRLGRRCGVLCSAWSFDGLRTNGLFFAGRGADCWAWPAMRPSKSAICPVRPELVEGAHRAVSVLRRAQGERGLCLRGGAADWLWCGGRCGVLCSGWSFDRLRTNGVWVCGGGAADCGAARIWPK